MANESGSLTRRRLLAGATALVGSTILGGTAGGSQEPRLAKAIPSSGEALPVIGMGTWITFNVGDDPVLRDRRAEVLAAFFQAGGGMVDSSPMYGSAQAVMGYCLQKLGMPAGLFSADKVWTSSGSDGPSQIVRSLDAWRLPRFDLLQIHNLRAWEPHLETLSAMKAEGRLRYLGITTSHGRRHGDMEEIMARYPLDFVQLTYNLVDREVENRLLPVARERGIAVIVNRPFRGGRLIDWAKRQPLPPIAAEIACRTWAEYLLKFVVSHPDVTCAIPATSQVAHMQENMAAGLGRLPDAGERRRMLDAAQAL